MMGSEDKVLLSVGTQVTTWPFGESRIHCVQINGEPAFFAREINDALGYSSPNQVASKIGEADSEYIEGVDYWKLIGEPLKQLREVVNSSFALGAQTSANAEAGLINPKTRHLFLLSESGVNYACGAASTIEGAAFRRWVYGEVLPTLRKTGSYNLGSSCGAQSAEPNPLQLEALRAQINKHKLIGRNLDAAFAIQGIDLEEYRAGRRDLVRQQLPHLKLPQACPAQRLIPGV